MVALPSALALLEKLKKVWLLNASNIEIFSMSSLSLSCSASGDPFPEISHE